MTKLSANSMSGKPLSQALCDAYDDDKLNCHRSNGAASMMSLRGPSGIASTRERSNCPSKEMIPLKIGKVMFTLRDNKQLLLADSVENSRLRIPRQKSTRMRLKS